MTSCNCTVKADKKFSDTCGNPNVLILLGTSLLILVDRNTLKLIFKETGGSPNCPTSSCMS